MRHTKKRMKLERIKYFAFIFIFFKRRRKVVVVELVKNVMIYGSCKRRCRSYRRYNLTRCSITGIFIEYILHLFSHDNILKYVTLWAFNIGASNKLGLTRYLSLSWLINCQNLNIKKKGFKLSKIRFARNKNKIKLWFDRSLDPMSHFLVSNVYHFLFVLFSLQFQFLVF